MLSAPYCILGEVKQINNIIKLPRLKLKYLCQYAAQKGIPCIHRLTDTEECQSSWS